jgi:8-hydroxy-5-deazaflavin:NADPH oxidoreductase
MTKLSKVAIIGLGSIGQVVASNLVKGNRPVIVANRDFSKATKLAEQLGRLATAMDMSSAIEEADIVVLSVWFDAIKELLDTYKTELVGKIIIDPSNPIAPDGKGGFVKTIAENESAGQQLAKLLPRDAKLVKALGTLGAASLANAAGQKPELKVLFYALDDKNIIGQIETLIRDCGFEPICVGGIEKSKRIEVFGDLHEFGALGQTVTLSEAKAKI